MANKNRGRGRPKGSTNSKNIGKNRQLIPKKEEAPYIPPKSHKFLGYCSKCKNMIGANDLISKLIFLCPFCNVKNRISTLKKERAKVSDANTKREFLKDTLNVDYHDMPALNEPEVKL